MCTLRNGLQALKIQDGSCTTALLWVQWKDHSLKPVSLFPIVTDLWVLSPTYTASDFLHPIEM